MQSLLSFNLMIFEICRPKATERSGDFFVEDSDPDLRKFGLSSPDAKVGRLFWETCVLLQVDQQVMKTKEIR